MLLLIASKGYAQYAYACFAGRSRNYILFIKNFRDNLEF